MSRRDYSLATEDDNATGSISEIDNNVLRPVITLQSSLSKLQEINNDVDNIVNKIADTTTAAKVLDNNVANAEDTIKKDVVTPIDVNSAINVTGAVLEMASIPGTNIVTLSAESIEAQPKTAMEYVVNYTNAANDAIEERLNELRSDRDKRLDYIKEILIGPTTTIGSIANTLQNKLDASTQKVFNIKSGTNIYGSLLKKLVNDIGKIFALAYNEDKEAALSLAVDEYINYTNEYVSTCADEACQVYTYEWSRSNMTEYIWTMRTLISNIGSSIVELKQLSAINKSDVVYNELTRVIVRSTKILSKTISLSDDVSNSIQISI